MLFYLHFFFGTRPLPILEILRTLVYRKECSLLGGFSYLPLFSFFIIINRRFMRMFDHQNQIVAVQLHWSSLIRVPRDSHENRRWWARDSRLSTPIRQFRDASVNRAGSSTGSREIFEWKKDISYLDKRVGTLSRNEASTRLSLMCRDFNVILLTVTHFAALYYRERERDI